MALGRHTSPGRFSVPSLRLSWKPRLPWNPLEKERPSQQVLGACIFHEGGLGSWRPCHDWFAPQSPTRLTSHQNLKCSFLVKSTRDFPRRTVCWILRWACWTSSASSSLSRTPLSHPTGKGLCLVVFGCFWGCLDLSWSLVCCSLFWTACLLLLVIALSCLFVVYVPREKGCVRFCISRSFCQFCTGKSLFLGGSTFPDTFCCPTFRGSESGQVVTRKRKIGLTRMVIPFGTLLEGRPNQKTSLR